MKSQLKEKIVVAFSDKEFNTEISYDNIYMGDIYRCIKYKSKAQEAAKRGVTDFEGFDTIYIEGEMYQKDAVLVKLGNPKRPYYIEFNNYSRSMILNKIKKHKHSITVTLDNIILSEQPISEDMLFLDKNSVKKINIEYQKFTGICVNKNQKVKRMIKRQFNEWNNINK